jgi:enediyne biosynthesis protein E4
VDLVVTQNATATKLYRNRGAKPGLRVRLIGPPGNPTGVGAVMRLKSGERFGPAREIHAGAGYWSQDSPVQVLSRLPEPLKLWVRWPGGKTTMVDIPAGASEIESSIAGELKVKR